MPSIPVLTPGRPPFPEGGLQRIQIAFLLSDDQQSRQKTGKDGLEIQSGRKRQERLEQIGNLDNALHTRGEKGNARKFQGIPKREPPVLEEGFDEVKLMR